MGLALGQVLGVGGALPNKPALVFLLLFLTTLHVYIVLTYHTYVQSFC